MSRSNDVGTSVVAIRCTEALEKIGNIAGFVFENCGDQETAKYMNHIISEVEAALSKPPRNCDVGSAKEQFERWQAFCNTHDDDCTGCPCDRDSCTLACCFSQWAQMPYEEEQKGEEA